MAMKKLIAFAALGLTFAAPAHATGGFVCKTAGPGPVEVSLGFGHVPGAPLILTRLLDDGRVVAAKPAQWWLDQQEMRLLLIDPAAHRQQLLLKARRRGHFYDGTIWRNGRSRWVRCREG